MLEIAFTSASYSRSSCPLPSPDDGAVKRCRGPQLGVYTRLGVRHTLGMRAVLAVSDSRLRHGELRSSRCRKRSDLRRTSSRYSMSGYHMLMDAARVACRRPQSACLSGRRGGRSRGIPERDTNSSPMWHARSNAASSGFI